jgi:outer membrane protein assembly factor BamE
MKRYHALLAIAFLATTPLGITGCSSWNPYRPEMFQGNIVTSESIAKLKIGMPSSQVQAILGTPVVGDIFHPEHWDYLYYHSKRGEKVSPQHLSLWFENDTLARWTPETPPTPLSTGEKK